jgi:thiosulfate/3-mercaptopyruvate sulfurtransferase
LPFQSFLKTVESSSGEKYTVFRSKEETEAEVGDVLGVEFMKQAKEGERSIITSCGSGMTAGVLWLGLQLLQIKSIRLYDEVSLTSRLPLQYLIVSKSWTGYASREDSVIQRAT